MESEFVDLQSIRVTAVTWNVNAKIESNIMALRTQLLGLPGRALVLPKGDVHRNPLFSHMNVSMEALSLEPDILPQIVIVGLQEIIELNTSNVIGGTVTGQNSIDQLNIWQNNLEKALNHHLSDYGVDEDMEYLLLARQSMVGLGILVFTLKSMRPLIRHVQVSSLARGVGGMLGNKGAVYVRFQILDSSLCIVNAHFTAHREHVEKRNNDFWAIFNYPAFPDYLSQQSRLLDQQFADHTNTTISYLRNDLKTIRRKLQILQALPAESAAYYAQGAGLTSALKPLGGSSQDLNPISELNTTSNSTQMASTSPIISSMANNPTFSMNSLPTEGGLLSANDHDIILWLGDLNYRIVHSLHLHTVYTLIDHQTPAILSEFDQLTIERDQGTVFPDFNEGLLTFGHQHCSQWGIALRKLHFRVVAVLHAIECDHTRQVHAASWIRVHTHYSPEQIDTLVGRSAIPR